ncbi:MAG: SDR family NAD(P)-dependent oxidoreductase [Actinobacteria bacterium]|nr:SDR family NAD(P)-dependent oxidoreductase [Actinomycetota bacterium]
MSGPGERFDLGGRKALVTGGSRGLGKVTALALAEAGAEVIVSSRRQEACEEVAAEIRAKTGRAAYARACHLGRWEELDDLVEAAYASLGSIDILVNNAGMSPLYERPSSVGEDLWDKVVNLNLRAPFRLTALIGERMAAADGGSIINVSSAAAASPHAGVIPYAAAKAGLNAITTAFSRAYGPTVRVNAIMPGTFLTDVSEVWDIKTFERDAEGFALRRGAEPEEIVGTMLYLASAASSYTTGAVLAVDGGYLLPPNAGR